ncbi:PEGA domain-containing protein [Candidatus Saccharibacteria bacterium]|nr:PEGA domain-containing protein [Candidatus Saccharibacteria bacterium]
MDRQRTKRIRSARVIATNIFMGIAVVAIVAVLLLIAMGFSFNEKGNLEQSGLLQIASRPSRATVEIDGKQLLSLTEVNKMVSNGEHDIKISKSGYDTWSKHIDLDAGLLTRIDWVRLFPINQVITTTDTFNTLRLISYSNDNKHLLTSETDSTNIHYINLQGNETNHKKLDLTKILKASKEQVRQGAFTVESWNEANNKVILRWIRGDQINWYLVDINDEDKSIDLTKKFGFNFTQINAINDSATKLWALENGNLHTIDVNDLKISSALATGVESFAYNKDTAAYVTNSIPVATTDQDLDAESVTEDNFNANDVTPENTGRALYTYKDGEAGSVKIFDLKPTDSIVFALGTYWGDEWIAYSINNNIRVISGKYPTYKKSDSSTLELIMQHNELPYSPTSVDINMSNRVIVFWSGKDVASFDIETRDYFDFELDTSNTINWLDNYLLWESTGDKIIIRDFDGDNRREIINNTKNADHAIITNNNDWLYYFDQVEVKTKNDEEQAADAEATTEDTPPVYNYILKRLKLTI